ncbi:MAG TPA: methyltransferase, TIGR04325 family [Terrimicrobiaceae bacterium]
MSSNLRTTLDRLKPLNRENSSTPHRNPRTLESSANEGDSLARLATCFQTYLNTFVNLRRLQIRALAKVLSWMGHYPTGRSCLISLRSRRWTRNVFDQVLGYRRTFVSFAAAQKCASRYDNDGHEHPDEIAFHVNSSQSLRESDYPVLFFLSEHCSQFSRVFDLGGNVGNLLYAYQDYLRFSGDLIWMIFDLPEQKRLGTKLAIERNERRIRYVHSTAEANGVDLFIASGSLHYFDLSLPEILGRLDDLPQHVIVNRTPYSSREAILTVQDGVSSVVPCKLHSRSQLEEGMNKLGYLQRGQWPIHERTLRVPLYPEYSYGHYLGFYFERI